MLKYGTKEAVLKRVWNDPYEFGHIFLHHMMVDPSTGLEFTDADFHRELYELMRDCVLRQGLFQKKRGLIAAASRGFGKCLSGDTLIQLSNGKSKSLKNIEVGEEIVSLNDDLKFEKDTIVAKVKSGKKDVIKVRTRSGKEVILTKEHRVLTFNGWKTAGELSIKDRIASPRRVPIDPTDFSHTDEEVKLVAYFITEGSTSPQKGTCGCSFTNSDKEVVDDFISCCSSMGFSVKKTSKYGYGVSHENGKSHAQDAGPRARENNLVGWSTTKRIPEWIFCIPERQKWIFIEALMVTDGYFNRYGNAGICLANGPLIDDICRLFQQVGLFSAKSKKKENGFAGCWTLYLDNYSVKLLLENCGLKQKRESAVISCRDNGYSLFDTYPSSVKKLLVNFDRLAAKNGIRSPNKYDMTKNKLHRLSKLFNVDRWNILDNADVFWDKVTEISEFGVVDTYDVQVEKNQNLLTNGLVTHNSAIVSLIGVIWALCCEHKRFVVIFSDTDSQAEMMGVNIRSEFEENKLLKLYFGDMSGERFKLKWTLKDFVVVKTNENNIRTFTGRVKVRGTGSSIRGIRERNVRPDWLVCHEKGTRIYTSGRWMNVEDHQTATEITSDGLEVRLESLPLPEVVTREHMYFVRSFEPTTYKRSKSTSYVGWMTANDIQSSINHEKSWKDKKIFIGDTINTEVGYFSPVSVYKPGNISERDDKGRIVSGTGGGFELEIPIEFNDPEWWWFFGLWWGDGHTTRRSVGITIADKDEKVHNRVVALLSKYDIKFSLIDKESACHQIIFCKMWMSNWLKTWRIGNSRKCPPSWVEKLPLEYQVPLIQGYIAADGWVQDSEVRLTSIYLTGLYCVRRILARIGIASSIRHGIGSRPYNILGKTGVTSKKYDLRFRNGAYILGYEVNEQTRYGIRNTFIEDGILWTKVRYVKSVKNKVFVPIQTEDHTYKTVFGLSHNCDDCENDSHVESKEQREKLYQSWWASAVLHMLDPLHGSITMVGTRIHQESLLSKLLRAKNTYVTRLWTCYNRDGNSAWEQRFPTELLHQMQEENPIAFAREMLNDPSATGLRLFRPEYGRFYTGKDVWFDGTDWWWKNPSKKNSKPELLELYTAVDPAIDEKDKSCQFALITAGVTKDRQNIILLRVTMDRIDFPTQIETCLAENDLFHPVQFGFETTGYQRALSQWTKHELKESIHVKELKHGGGSGITKRRRIMTLAPLFKQGRIWLRAASEGQEGEMDELDRVLIHHDQYPLYRQMMSYPETDLDDGVDCLASLVETIGGSLLQFPQAEVEEEPIGFAALAQKPLYQQIRELVKTPTSTDIENSNIIQFRSVG